MARRLRLFFFSSRRRHTRFDCDWSSDVCSSDLGGRSPHLPTRTPARYRHHLGCQRQRRELPAQRIVGNTDRKSTRLNSSHSQISYAVFCLKKKKKKTLVNKHQSKISRVCVLHAH